MKHAWLILMITGGGMVALAGVMFVIAASMFTMTQEPPPWLDTIGFISFWGLIPTAMLGFVLFAGGIVLLAASRDGRG